MKSRGNAGAEAAACPLPAALAVKQMVGVAVVKVQEVGLPLVVVLCSSSSSSSRKVMEQLQQYKLYLMLLLLGQKSWLLQSQKML
jgi:hypothetical protein